MSYTSEHNNSFDRRSLPPPLRGVTHDSYVYVHIDGEKKKRRVYIVSVGLVLFKDKHNVLVLV